MYSKIMVPVDLEHVEALEKSIEVAANLAREYDAEVCYVGITGNVPNRVAPSPEKFAEVLDAFAREQADRHAIRTRSRAVPSVDPAVEKDDKLVAIAAEIEADLIVMASHIPNVADRMHLIGSNAAWLVRHVDISVFVVR